IGEVVLYLLLIDVVRESRGVLSEVRPDRGGVLPRPIDTVCQPQLIAGLGQVLVPHGREGLPVGRVGIVPRGERIHGGRAERGRRVHAPVKGVGGGRAERGRGIHAPVKGVGGGRAERGRGVHAPVKGIRGGRAETLGRLRARLFIL